MACGSLQEPGLIGYRIHCLVGQVGSQLSIFFQWLPRRCCMYRYIDWCRRTWRWHKCVAESPPRAQCPQPSTAHVIGTHVAAIVRCCLAGMPSGEPGDGYLAAGSSDEDKARPERHMCTGMPSWEIPRSKPQYRGGRFSAWRRVEMIGCSALHAGARWLVGQAGPSWAGTPTKLIPDAGCTPCA